MKFLPEYKNSMISVKATLRDALGAITRSGAMMACVVDENDKLLGIITDSDVRRALLNGGLLEDAASMWMNVSPLTLPAATAVDEIALVSAREGIREIPLLSSSGKLSDVYVAVFHEARQLELDEDVLQLNGRRLLPNPMFILAGGRGLRLRSVVSDRPKPLALVGGKPIIQTIIEQAKKYGIRKFYVSVNYLGEKVEAHLKADIYSELDITVIKETEFLGTAGSIGLIPDEITENIIVCNGDILTKMPFDTLLKFHSKQSADMSCVVRPHRVSVPFGVVNINDGRIESINEKPTYSYLVNSGIYVVSPSTIRLIQKDRRLDMTELMKVVIDQKKKISPFMLYEYWMDIGQPEDFQKASQDFNQHFEGN